MTTNLPESSVPDTARGGGHKAARWGKRLGVVAFLFFLVKGLAWLIVPAMIAVWAAS